VSLDTLFDPSSIAVVGASETPDNISHEAMQGVHSLSELLHPVNPSAEGE
jgi:acyl-CoA synthetase (NDP forming)